MVCSKQALQGIVGHEISAISYPHGKHDERICNAAQKCGYKMGFTIEPRVVSAKTDDFRIGRFYVSPNDSLIKFKLKVSGAYEVENFLRTLKLLLFWL